VTELDAHGVSVTLPTGWEGRVSRRPEAGEAPPDDVASSRLTPAEAVAPAVESQPTTDAPAPPGETTNTVVHVATIALPAGSSDFASDSVDQLGRTDALIVLFEYDREAASEPLFAKAGIPRVLQPSDFDPGVLQRSIRGQAGAQAFFHEGDRAFCLYVVLGSYDARADVVPEVNKVLSTMQIDGGTPAPVKGTVLDAIMGRPDWSTFATLLASTPVATDLAGATAVTVFAPLNGQIPDATLTTLRADPDLLSRTLLQHIVPESIPPGVLPTHPVLSTMAGGSLTVTSVGGLRVGGIATGAPEEAVDGFVYPLSGIFQAPS
jgi:uncharacterized surface protein with fasciclin (FAS1) repeats